MTAWMPLVSIGIIALNEEDHLPQLLNDIRAQDYPLDHIELVLVDSGSTDNTRELMEQYAQTHDEFNNIIVLDNPKKVLAPGWNIFLNSFNGDVAVRVDAHAQLPKDFISRNIEVLSEGEKVCGGDRPCIVPENATTWNKVLLAAEASVFGASIATYRGGRSSTPGYVSSLFHGAYLREVVDEVGPLNEELLRTEDNDFYYRMRQAGFHLKLDPRIVSYQIVRSSLRSMLKQKYGNGYWIGRTFFIQPGAINLHHLVPVTFVASLGISTILASRGRPGLLKLVGGTYLGADTIMSAIAMKDCPRSPESLALPAVFPLLHVAYGTGTLRGIIDGLRMRKTRP